MLNAMLEQRNPAMHPRHSSDGNADEPATSNRNPWSEHRTAKNEELMNDHVRAGRKYKLSFEIFHPRLSPSSGYFRRVSSLISAPSSSQFTRYSMLPYQRRYSPPLLY